MYVQNALIVINIIYYNENTACYCGHTHDVNVQNQYNFIAFSSIFIYFNIGAPYLRVLKNENYY